MPQTRTTSPSSAKSARPAAFRAPGVVLRALIVLAIGLCGPSARAVQTDRLAVEILDAETPREALLAYERACYRLGAPLEHVRPVQRFETHGGQFVRLYAEGSPLILRCLRALEPGRRGVDGSFTWFDGFQGGLLVPSAQKGDEGEDDRIPDEVWANPELPQLPRPAVDAERVERLAHGDSEGQKELAALPLDEALATVDAVAAQGGAGATAALEKVARTHPHWRVRREAVDALDPAVSAEALIQIARTDKDWEVRHGALEAFGIVPEAPGGPLQKHEQAAQALRELLRSDPEWEVRRQAIWQMSAGLVEASKGPLRDAAQHDADARVRAAAWEALAGIGQLPAADARQAMHDPAPAVRAVAASALATQLTRADAPLLWDAMQAPERIVRLAAAALLLHVDDRTIGPQVWQLYLRESEELDADPTYQQVLLDFLARAPFPQLAAEVEARLTGELPPDERRLLSRLLARIAPKEAVQRLVPQLASPDATLRSIAADALPDTPEVHARRLELLEDDDADVRAGAVLGLCRAPARTPRESLGKANLEPLGLGHDAAIAAAHCGEPEVLPPRLATQLEESPAEAADSVPNHDRAFWPAIAAILLLLTSVLAEKLSRGARTDEQPHA